MKTRTITVRLDFQPQAGTEFTASAYPEPGAYLVDYCGMKQVAFVSMDGSVDFLRATKIGFDLPPADIPPTAPESPAEPPPPMVREAFALALVATALAPDRRASP